MAARPQRREWLTVGAIFATALVLRLLHLQQIAAHDPFFDQPAADPRFYHEWALRIAGGDWLGEGVFLHGPLYPYLLAILYRIFGEGFLLPRLVQCVVGAGTCVLTWGLARELFRGRVAEVAGFGAAVYPMLVFYEGSLLLENWLLPLVTGAAWLSLRALAAPTSRRWLGVGVVVGLGALARPNLLLYAAFLVGWLAFALRPRPGGERLRFAAAFALGVALCIAPSALRNTWVAGDFVLVSASGGMNFYNGNNPTANGMHNVPPPFDRAQADDPAEQSAMYAAYAERALGRTLSASEVSDFWLARGLDFVREQPGRWLGLQWRKLLIFFNHHEVWNNRSVDLAARFSWLLRLPLPGFGVVAPLALLGLGLTARRWRELAPLHGLLAVHLVTCLALFVLSRYRVPIVPLLLVFAAQAAVWLVDAVAARRARALAGAAVALAAAVLLVWGPRVPDDLSVAYYNLGNKYLARQHYELAVEQYLRSLDGDPGYISAYNNLALALEGAGDRARALATWRQVQAIAQRRGLERYLERAQRRISALEAATALP